MQHLQVKAAATTTDKGEFSAIAAAYTVDRMQEEIVPGAFEKTIAAWKSNGRQIPLHWDHEASAEAIIGTVDPSSMRETKDGLYVEGTLDLENSEVAREAWRSMKNNALALSFGYLATKTKKKGNVTQLLEIDLFEISVVPAPANDSTRVLSLKSALAEEVKAEEEEAKDEFKSVEEVQAFLDEKFPGHQISQVPERKGNDVVAEAWREFAPHGVPSRTESSDREVEPQEPLDLAALQREGWNLALKPRS